MASVQQHGATPQRMPLADRPLKSRDRRAAHGNGTAFSAVAPSERPVLPSIDPIFGSGIPQARMVIQHSTALFGSIRFFHSRGQPELPNIVSPICNIPPRNSFGCLYDL